jgi:hypothetical protein
MFSAILLLVITLRTPHPFGSPDFAPTPWEAVQNIVGGAVVRTNVVGRYATVLVHDAGGYFGPARGPSRADAVILVERFSFGWQPLEDLYSPCRMNSHVRSPRSRNLLMRGITTGQTGHQADCSSKPSDFGSPAEIDAVRRLETGPLVPSVVVVENYALGGWYEQGGGPHLFKKMSGRWHLIARAGGAADESWLQMHDVPETALVSASHAIPDGRADITVDPMRDGALMLAHLAMRATCTRLSSGSRIHACRLVASAGTFEPIYVG